MAGSYIELPVDPTSFGSNTIELNVKPREETIPNSERIHSEIGGGFSYINETKITKHRQILWKVIGNVVKLEEISLDHNLYGNKLELRIADEIILPNVIIKENEKELNVFVATTRTIHQLIFVHPNHCKYGFIVPSGVHVAFPSVFNDAPVNYRHRHATLSHSCSGFDVAFSNGVVNFGLITDAKTLLLANLTDVPEESSCLELKDASVIQRIWTGLVPSFVRGDSTWQGVESVVMHSFNSEEVYAFTLCKDLKIRVWNVRKQCFVMIKDLAQLLPEKDDSQPMMSIASLALTKANAPSSKQLIVAAHCCFGNSSKFIILEIMKEQKDIIIMHVSNFYSCFNSVQAVSLTSQFISVLWNTSDGGHSISYAPIEGGKNHEKGWHAVHSKHLDKEDLFTPLYQDAKEIYLERIFSPGNFNKESVLKALQVFTKTLDIESTKIPDTSSEVAVIKEAVIQILELEIERNVIVLDIHPSDYQELQHQCWSKYFSFVQQCYQAREKPLGLYMSENNDLSMVIRQEACGYHYSIDWVDHLYLTELDSCEAVASYIESELETVDESVVQDIQLIFTCLKSIPNEFNSEVIEGIDHDLDRNEDVKAFLTSMSASLLSNNSDFEQLIGEPIQRGSYLSQLGDRLKHIANPEKSIEVILTALTSTELPSTANYDDTESFSNFSHSSQLLCGKIGIEVLTQVLKQTALNRMHLCRDLFVLLKVMDKIGLSREVSNDFGTLTSNSCYELLRSYHAVYWSAKTNFADSDTSTIDTNVHHLAALHLTERGKSLTDVVDDSPVSLLTSFIRNVGMKKSLNYLTENNLNSMKPGDYSMPVMIRLIAKAVLHEIWLLNGKGSDFAEYLATECQYCTLMDYLHFCDEWCSHGRGTKDYLLAKAYLGTGEPHKALSYLFSAARGISLKEPLLMNLISDETTGKRDSALVQYFVKVMRLFEQFEYPTYVISAATSALTIAAKDDPNVPMLWSVIFKYHMELEHYNEAYATIVHNTDKTRRNDCLRHFIITLCDAGLFRDICSYPYTSMEDEVVGIIEARARTTDITVNRYYDLLYSYHIIQGDYRKAASGMYEHAYRITTEMHGTKSLQKQAKCYLAAITALKLVKAKDAWIVRPHEKMNTAGNPQPSPEREYSQSPKRRENGEEIFYSGTKVKKTNKAVIVEVDDLEKEYLLIFSRLKLIQNKKGDTVTVGPSLSAAETVGLLAQAGLFDIAFSVSTKFKLSFKTIFEWLAAKCAQLANHKPSELDERWKWLTFNELCTSQVLTSKNATDHAFHLLQTYLKKFQKNNSSVHYKAVTSKFLSMGCSLPSWLISLYELSNPAELLHIYLCFDMVPEASELSLKYVDAVLGHGKEYLGLNTALHATTPAVWLPYTSFDQLLTALRANYENPEAAQICEELQEKLDDYFVRAEITSLDKLNYLHTLNSSLAVG